MQVAAYANWLCGTILPFTFTDLLNFGKKFSLAKYRIDFNKLIKKLEGYAIE